MAGGEEKGTKRENKRERGIGKKKKEREGFVKRQSVHTYASVCIALLLYEKVIVIVDMK